MSTQMCDMLNKITDYFKPISRNADPTLTALRQLSLDQACDSIIKQYESKLQSEAQRCGKILVMIEDVHYWSDFVYDGASDEEKRDPKIQKRILQRLVEFLQSLVYVFITKNANQNLSRIVEAQHMVDRDHFLDMDRTTTRPSSYKLQLIFEMELRLCDELVEIQRFDLATDLLIALLLGLRQCPDGFWRCRNQSEALQILDHFGSLWQKTMHSDMMTMTGRKRDCLYNGYIRDFAQKYHLEIPMDICGVICHFGQSVLDKRSKKVFYDRIALECDHLMEYGGYSRGFRYGQTWIPDDIVNVDGHKKVHLDVFPISANVEKGNDDDTKRSVKTLKALSTVQLRAICRAEKRCAIDIAGSDRKTLIKYLSQPKEYILHMKRKYHYGVIAHKKQIVSLNADRKEFHLRIARQVTFDERRYLARGGTVIERDAFWCEIRGQHPYEAGIHVRDDEECIAEAIQQKKKKAERKRERTEHREAVRAVKKRKLCPHF